MDLLRGASIFLVTFNHAILFSVEFGGAPLVAQVANQALAPVRMPLMVFMSGLLVGPSLAKGWRPYVSGKARRVLYPYVVWSVIVFLMRSIGDPSGMVARAPEFLLAVAIEPVSHLWFL
ncbi:acyltransferase family protein [Miniimonas sp. S16]|uniref:acyltransferase family protein n=1 Tax=Miniimonas sp. S16 TaxID=2171623 RepID=UPI000D52A7C5|nr:acyltransferase family protein [Miniimonas sp. S16]